MSPAVGLTSYLFARHGTDGVQTYDGDGTKIYYHREYLANGTPMLNMVPCVRNSDNEPGMYDLISGQFFTNQGSGAFSAGATVSDPVEVYTDGTVETIWVRGKNLWDGKMYRGQLNQGRPYIDNTVVTSPFTSPTAYSGVALVVKVVPGKQYCFSSDVTNAQYKYVGFYANREDVTDYTKIISRTTTTTATAPEGANYAVFCCANATSATEFSWTWAQAEDGSTATDYEPYYDGGTATAEMLLSIGDYTDVQEILSGDVTRKVGVKVFDGTENWTWSASGFVYLPISDAALATDINSGIICTHLSYTSAAWASGDGIRWNAVGTNIILAKKTGVSSADDWKQWVADQYAAGTPVIIVYPLATATTESVTGQPMSVVKDITMTQEITQASMTGLNIESTYLGK